MHGRKPFIRECQRHPLSIFKGARVFPMGICKAITYQSAVSFHVPWDFHKPVGNWIRSSFQEETTLAYELVTARLNGFTSTSSFASLCTSQGEILHETIKIKAEQSRLFARKNYSTEEFPLHVKYSCPHVIIEL